MGRVKAVTHARVVAFGTGQFARRVLAAPGPESRWWRHQTTTPGCGGPRVSEARVAPPADIGVLAYGDVPVCSARAADIARRARLFNGPILALGYPRNDYLFSANRTVEIDRLRGVLGIPPSR